MNFELGFINFLSKFPNITDEMKWARENFALQLKDIEFIQIDNIFLQTTGAFGKASKQKLMNTINQKLIDKFYADRNQSDSDTVSHLPFRNSDQFLFIFRLLLQFYANI